MGITGVTSDKFEFQSTITSVHFGSNCTFIEHEAFNTCESLEVINDDNVIENIGDGAFHKTNISSATFNNLKNISAGGLTSTNKYGAFQDCAKLSYISIPKCESIGDNAFNNCISLNEINLSNAIYIGNYAFSNCSNLKSVNINKPSMHNYAFANCSNLSNIYLDNCSEIGEGAFLNCTSLNTINLNECKKIGSSAFYNCTSITQLTLSKCEEIYPFAFANCHSLNKVYINTEYATCQLMGDYVFCTHSGSTCLKNENIVFYFKPETLEYYKSSPYWSHYADNMVMITNEREIIYITNDNKPIEFISYDNSDSDSDNDYTHGYLEKFGLISFNYDIITLNNQIFKDQKTLISVDLPCACEIIEENAFENCINLKSITLSEVLMEIQDSAFKNCKSLTQFEIPDTITKLGEGIFAGCKNIIKFQGKSNFIKNNGNALVYNDTDKVTLICVLPNDDSDTEGRIYKISEIDENITRLGKSCFSGCEKLRRVDISPNVKEIGDYAFEGCKNLREVHFSGDEPPTLGEYVFGTVIDDFKIFVPEEYLEIYYTHWAKFDYKDYLYPMPTDNAIICYSESKLSFDIGKVDEITNDIVTNGRYYKISNVVGVPASYFASKDTITKVILGSGVTSLGAKAFEKCTSLNYIYLSDKITKIGDYCFSGCENLKSIHIPKLSKSAFGNYIFDSALEEFGTYYKGYVSDDNRCYIDGDTGTLMFFAFAKGNSNEETYTIPDNITTINNYVFSTSEIKHIKLKPSVKTIGQYAFSDCLNLESIEDWHGVKTIEICAFRGCTSLGKISLPSNLVTIGNSAFNGCKNMYINTNIPDSVTSIGMSAFYGCEKFKYLNDDTNEKEIIKLNNITTISQSLFWGCKELSEIEISSKVKSIGLYAFRECTNLTSVISSHNSGTFERLTNIGSYAFYGCINLKNFDLDKADYIESINSYAFYNCSKYKGGNSGQLLLKNISPIGIGAYSFSRSGIENLKLSSSCKLSTIQFYAFSNCMKLKCVDMSKSQYIQKIEAYAFSGCTNLENIKLSNSIVSIQDYAFYLCENIFYIELPSNLQRLGVGCFGFNNVSTSPEIHIPTGLKPPLFERNGVANANISIFDTKPKIICKNNTDTNTYKNNTFWKKYSLLISTGSQIIISMINAYLEYNTLGTKYKITDIGQIDTSRHIYLYNSLWQCYKNAPFSFRTTDVSPYDILLIVDKQSLKNWYNKSDGDINFYYNISIPMITNDNKKFRILYNISLKSYLNTSITTPITINMRDAMLSMNTSTYNGEDYDNIAHFYYNKNLSGELQLQINRYKPNYGVQINTINVPGELKNDILPSRVYMNSLNGQELYKISTLKINGWTKFDDIDISDYFSLLQNFKNLNHPFSYILYAIDSGVCIDFKS